MAKKQPIIDVQHKAVVTTEEMQEQINKTNKRIDGTQKLILAVQNLKAADHAREKLKERDHFAAPLVMDETGKFVKYTDLLQQYASDENMAMDGCGGGSGYNFNQYNLNNLDRLLVDNFFIGYGQLSILQQNGIIYSICEVLSREMCREWIEFSNVGDKDNADRMHELEVEFERLAVRERFERGVFQTFAFGGCLLYPKLKGDEDNQEREMPLDIDSMKIGIGDVEYLQVIEPLWAVPIRWVSDNPFSEWYYKPEYYTVLGMITHESRVMKFIYNEAPDILKPTYLFYGIPLVQQCIPYIVDFEVVRTNITAIVCRYNLSVLGTNIEAIINDNLTNPWECAGANLANRINAFNATRNNLGVLAIDKEMESFEQVNMQVTGLKEILSQTAELICIVPKIPATKLLGLSPGGFNSSGEFEMNNFYDLIRSLQNKIMRNHLIRVMHIAMLNIWGEIDDSISFEFLPLEAADPSELAEIRLKTAQEISIYEAVDIISPQEARDRIRTDKASGWDVLEEHMKKDENLESEYMGNPDDVKERSDAPEIE